MNLTINVSSGDISIWSSKEIKQLKAISDRLDDLFTQLEYIKKQLTPARYISPELERAIIAVGRRAVQIDRKVED